MLQEIHKAGDKFKANKDFLPLANNMVCHGQPPLKYIAFFQPGDAVWNFRNLHSGAKTQGMVPDLLILQLIENRKNMCNLFLKL